jgi:hypothetical protein
MDADEANNAGLAVIASAAASVIVATSTSIATTVLSGLSHHLECGLDDSF